MGDDTLRRNQLHGILDTPTLDSQDRPLENDEEEYLAKERELREVSDLRIRTLERLVKEKVQLVGAQEQELAQAAQDLQRLRGQLAERERVSRELEDKLERGRQALEVREAEAARARVQAQDIYE